jgi:hypothetical protein
MKTTGRRPRPSPRRTAGGPTRPESRGLVRALVRRGSRSDRSPIVTRKRPAVPDPTLCAGCGAVFHRKTWRRSRRRTLAALRQEAPLLVCPACRQMAEHRALGQVRLEGTYVERHAAEIRRRILNAAARARRTQPERRLLGLEMRGPVWEVLTTSQKLAHRLGRELQKAFGGTVSYAWSDRDGSLLAVWRRDEDRPGPKGQ